jgi:cellulose synthase (UDP-forming)
MGDNFVPRHARQARAKNMVADWTHQTKKQTPVQTFTSAGTQVAERDPLLDIAEPSKLATAITRLRGKLLSRQRFFYWALMTIGLALAGRFAFFWFDPARLPHAFGPMLAPGDYALFAGLTFVIWHRQAMEILSWLICRRTDKHQEPPHPQPGLRVAFITTFVPGSESLDLIRQTLANMVGADYPHDTWLLDEGNSSEVRTVCATMGVRYFSRKGIEHYNQARGHFMAKTKAGNHNSWYAEHAEEYDVVAQIDTDFQVRPNFLTRTLGHFRDPRVAFVGTPQIYGNVHNLIARGAAQQTYLFYGPVMRALSQRRMTLLIGANHVVRVAALRDVGWYQGHLTEDLATGIRFHAGRWESVYVPEVLAIGEGPTTWESYFSQQYRWSYGCINIFFTQSPRLNFKMRSNHAFYYFLLEQFYFSGLAMAIAVILLVLYDLFGWVPANFEVHQLVLWYLPLLVWRQIMLLWLQRFNIRPREERGLLLAGRLLTIAAIPIYFMALVGVLCNRRATWKTTPKGNGTAQDDDSLRVFLPHTALCLVVAAGIGAAIVLRHTSWVFLGWGCVTASAMSAFSIALIYKKVSRALPKSWIGERIAFPQVRQDQERQLPGAQLPPARPDRDPMAADDPREPQPTGTTMG